MTVRRDIGAFGRDGFKIAETTRPAGTAGRTSDLAQMIT
jgi:hypothetical protein